MRILALIFALLVSAASADESKAIRCDFTSEPEGATVLIDGLRRGAAPLTLYDLLPGRHHVRFELPNYEGVDGFMSLREGGAAQKNAVLRPVKGLLLVTSEPAGCDLTLDGISLGKTPRLVTTLDAKETYRLQLQKPGYQPRQVEVKFNGRVPLVKHETLTVDSGTIEITSEPAGAEVMVNGIVRGKTPLTVREVPKGQATVSLKKNGFEDTVRELSMVAGETQTLFIQLTGIPGTMTLSSVPEGARFYVDDQPEGKGPVTLKGLKPGTYNIRCELAGYATMTKEIVIDNGGSANEEFRLENVMGRIEVRTIPAGVQVLLDGSNLGATKDCGDTDGKSEVFAIENVMKGEHTLTLRCDGYAENVKHPVVEDQKTWTANVRMKRVFVPDVEIVTNSGTHRGVLISNGATGVEVEISPGITRMFPNSEIRKINFLK